MAGVFLESVGVRCGIVHVVVVTINVEAKDDLSIIVVFGDGESPR
jgi:hypothetical protein